MASIARCRQGYALYVRSGPVCRRRVSHGFGLVMHLSNCAGVMFIRYSVAQFRPDGLHERVHVNRLRVADGPEVHAFLVPMND